MRKYAAFVCTFCRKENLKHLDASGVAKIIEYGSRLAADQEKLSRRLPKLPTSFGKPTSMPPKKAPTT